MPQEQKKELVIAGQKYSADKIALIKRTVCEGATNDELGLFFHQAQRTGLDPLSKQIYLIKRGNKATIQTGIDGYRTIADRTSKYAGSDDPIFTGTPKAPDFSASVTVYKLVNNEKCGFSATARWSEYYPGEKLGFMWDNKPHIMLGKCAEAQALRKAFPADLSGIYTAEEMEQADGEIVTKKVEVEVEDIEVKAVEGVVEKATEKQIKMIFAIGFQKLGIKKSGEEGKEELKKQLNIITPVKFTSFAELTKKQASEIIDYIQDDGNYDEDPRTEATV